MKRLGFVAVLAAGCGGDPADNGNSDCAALECVSYQDFNGTRPPQ